jgi:hypothetical protein
LWMTVLWTVRAVWGRWGGNMGVHVCPGVTRGFGEFVHSGAHMTGV